MSVHRGWNDEYFTRFFLRGCDIEDHDIEMILIDNILASSGIHETTCFQMMKYVRNLSILHAIIRD